MYKNKKIRILGKGQIWDFRKGGGILGEGADLEQEGANDFYNSKQIIFVNAIQRKDKNPITNKNRRIKVCAVVIFNLNPITRGHKKANIIIKIALKQINKPPKHKLENNIAAIVV